MLLLDLVNTGCAPGAATYHGMSTGLTDAFSRKTPFILESSVILIQTSTQCCREERAARGLTRDYALVLL